ncbi:MAG: NUDIX domain-containing protein, partial [Elusimicrobiota bacterium]|nr:NUDIX domain-containing protein [Elusimicrobiota bacterium]
MQKIKKFKTEFEFSAGGLVTDGDWVLLIKSRPSVSEKSFWTFPKGKIEIGETEEDAALREVEEETGCRCRIVKKLGETHYHFRRENNLVIKKVTWFLMKQTGNLRDIPDEPVKVKWKKKERALKLLKHSSD